MMKPAIAAAVMILAVGQGPRPAPAPAPRWPDGRINLGAPPGDKGLWERRTEHLVVNPRSYQAPATRNANSFRVIYMDGRGHPANLTPGYFGHSIGRWEGDTLVIDTVGFSERFWMNRDGLPHTSQLHLVERLTRVDFENLNYTELFEYQCQENNLSPESMVGDALSSTIVP